MRRPTGAFHRIPSRRPYRQLVMPDDSSILDMLRAGGRFHVDYGELWASSSKAADDTSRFGRAIEGEWSWLYEGSTPGERDVRAVTMGTFTWLIDATHAPTLSDPDNRLIGVYGTSTSQAGPRKKSRIAGFPLPESLSSRRVHRGHAAGHSLGGPDEGYNLFVQTAAVNVGREWRNLERYCAAHPGTFFFVRAVYLDISDIPAALEFGVIRDGGVLDVHHFENRRA